MIDAAIEKNLGRINSATKYPSIPTYHKIGDKGRLLEEVQVDFSGEKDLVLTEKIDGTNVRVVFFPDGDFIVGSREDLLFYSKDILHNPSMGIVESIREFAYRIAPDIRSFVDGMFVIYGELYGGKISKAAKNYTGEKTIGFRLFDAVNFDGHLTKKLTVKTREEISQWRQNGGQKFMSEDSLERMAGLFGTDLTPRIGLQTGKETPPQSIAETIGWMGDYLPQGKTRAILDSGGNEMAEGLVIRTQDRSKIAKLRFEDYARTLKSRGSYG